MKILVKICIGFAVLLPPITSLIAQEVPENPITTSLYEPYDPLIPQLFAFDKKHGIFAGINNVDNEIVVVSHNGESNLSITHRFLVDKVSGRHDEHFIYRPKSVAIYDGYVSFLASHRDSCYFAVLDTNGQLVQKMVFPGFASAFSYSPSANELYISGENVTGFDVIVLDTRHGVNHATVVSNLHYQKPRMSQEIAKRDPWGIGISVIAMSVVFLALILLYLLFKQVGIQLMAIQEGRRRMPRMRRAVEPKREAVSSNVAISEGVYAAIAAAIHLYEEELHDVENAVLTINKVSRTYSPWSSKIHGLNTYFKR